MARMRNPGWAGGRARPANPSVHDLVARLNDARRRGAADPEHAAKVQRFLRQLPRLPG